MWVIENDVVFKGKKQWLRPGKNFIFGRTRVEGNFFCIEDKTISRQHLIIEVAAAGAEDCPNARSRSRITLSDQTTKIGTRLNGEQIRGTSVVLDQDKNTVILGKYEHEFLFTWVPVTFTFSFTTKEQKTDPFTKLYETLGPLDIKVLTDFEKGLTTHVVAKKRNTSKGLQALIDGRYIVHNDSYIKAVVAATTPDDDGKAPLEKDFDSFPDPEQYLPPGANEPTQRTDDAYGPDPARRDMFEGYTFIFYNEGQFDTLLPPITQGGGKALLGTVVASQTTVEEFVRYVKSVAGEKGLGEFEDGSEGKGVVVVRYNPVKGADATWFAEFSTEVAQYLDHRLIEQNEFLDAILGNNASVLRRPLEPEASGVYAPPPSAATAVSQTLRSSQPAPDPTPAEPESQPEPSRRRRRAVPRFKGFDDDDDPPVIMASIPESMVVDSVPAEPESQGLFVSQDPDFNMDREPSQTPETQTKTSRKRKATPILEDDDEETFETMAPAAARLKKRRIEEDVARRGRGESTPLPPKAPKRELKATAPKPVKVKTKKEQQAEILEKARLRHEKIEELANQDKEVVNMDGFQLADLQSLAITETLELRSSAPAPRAPRADESERWEDKWNGRKNFKKFRRRGGPAINARDLGRTIVQLEEVKHKAAGVGDEYWVNEDVRIGKFKSQRSQRKGRVAEIEGDDVNLDQDDDNDDTLPLLEDIRPKPKTTPKSKSQTVVLSSDSEDEEPVIKQKGSRSQKLQDKTAEKGNVKPRPSQKRAAEKTLTKPAPVKRARQTVLGQKKDESEDSEEEGKFRFRKRG
ncbi:Nibrin [Lachnellula occidentalis]|uniref:Nibrin n=1 Tax=Lachnellula occidentalis TaxID=215460 RepID=A0A8H8U675_9HELO|nr:Nibrin [Lachnellula occidentalis]